MSVPEKVDGKSSVGSHDLDTNPIKYRQADGSLSEDAHDKDYMELTLRSGKHSELVQRLLRQRIEQRAQEYPRWPASLSSGVRTMWIESRFWYDRERLLPDYDEDWRKYRVKYLQSLELDPREPVHVPEYERYLINPIRRFYMKGGDLIENFFMKFTDERLKATLWRVWVTRGFMGYVVLMSSYYWIRYNHRKWDCGNRGPLLHISAPIMYATHQDYPFKDYRTEPSHHYDLGFSRRPAFKDLRDYEDGTATI